MKTMGKRIFNKAVGTNLLSKAFKPLCVYIFKVVLAFVVFIVLVYTYPYLPWVGGIHRNTFVPQQLNSSIHSYLEKGSAYKVFEIDFYGFGEHSYLIISDNSVRNYEENGYSKFSVEGDTYFLILEEMQQNPIDKLIFSNKAYKKSFDVTFPSSELSHFSLLKPTDEREIVSFCINNHYCGLLDFNNGFRISKLIDYPFESGYCHEDSEIEIQGQEYLQATKFLNNPRSEPIIHTKNSGEQLIIAYPLRMSEKMKWVRSIEFKFCTYDYAPYIRSQGYSPSGCYISTTRYTQSGYNFGILQGITDYFDSVVSFESRVFEGELVPCKWDGDGSIFP